MVDIQYCKSAASALKPLDWGSKIWQYSNSLIEINRKSRQPLDVVAYPSIKKAN